MPTFLRVTHEQLSALAELEEDVMLKELPPTLGRPVEAWVLDEHSQGDQHHTIIMDENGEVLSDMVVPDTETA